MENMIWRFQREDVEKRGWVEEYRDESSDPQKRPQEEVNKNQGNRRSVLMTDIPLRARGSSGMMR